MTLIIFASPLKANGMDRRVVMHKGLRLDLGGVPCLLCNAVRKKPEIEGRVKS
jgi:hypothetical protein